MTMSFLLGATVLVSFGFDPLPNGVFAVAEEHCSARGFCDSRQAPQIIPDGAGVPFETQAFHAWIRRWS
jgi:hypothetical protein